MRCSISSTFPNWYSVVKSLLGLVRRSLFNTIHDMTDYDSSFGPYFIVNNITKSDKILSLTFFTKTFFFQSIAEMFLHLMKHQHVFHSLSRRENETFLASYAKLQNCHFRSRWYSIICSTIAFGQLTKWQVDKMASWQDGKLTRWQVDKMASWQDGELTRWQLTKDQVEKTSSWQNDSAPFLFPFFWLNMWTKKCCKSFN